MNVLIQVHGSQSIRRRRIDSIRRILIMDVDRRDHLLSNFRLQLGFGRSGMVCKWHQLSNCIDGIYGHHCEDQSTVRTHVDGVYTQTLWRRRARRIHHSEPHQQRFWLRFNAFDGNPPLPEYHVSLAI